MQLPVFGLTGGSAGITREPFQAFFCPITVTVEVSRRIYLRLRHLGKLGLDETRDVGKRVKMIGTSFVRLNLNSERFLQEDHHLSVAIESSMPPRIRDNVSSRALGSSPGRNSFMMKSFTLSLISVVIVAFLAVYGLRMLLGSIGAWPGRLTAAGSAGAGP